MKNKKIILKTGETITLWLDESSGAYILDKEKAELSESNFQRYIIEEDESVCSNKYRTSILEYYNKSTSLTKRKIVSMINEDIKKIELVYNIVLDSIINKKEKAYEFNNRRYF